MTDAQLALMGVIFAAALSAYITVRRDKQKELQDYRRSLMQQYLECVAKFDQILANTKFETLSALKSENPVTETVAIKVLSNFDELRSLVIRASSILKATGDIHLVACGWALYQEALDNVDETGLFFKTDKYNPIHYFRIGLDIGLTAFAHTISTSTPASKTMQDMEINEQFTITLRETIARKYAENKDWGDRFLSNVQEKIPVLETKT